MVNLMDKIRKSNFYPFLLISEALIIGYSPIFVGILLLQPLVTIIDNSNPKDFHDVIMAFSLTIFLFIALFYWLFKALGLCSKKLQESNKIAKELKEKNK